MPTESSQENRAGAADALRIAIADADHTRAARTREVAERLGALTTVWRGAQDAQAGLGARTPTLILATAGPLADIVFSASARVDPKPVIIVLHGPAEIPTVVDAMRRGAFEYLAEPVDPGDLLDRMQNAIETAMRDRELQARRVASTERVGKLSRRMRLLAQEIMLGRSSAEIARRWGVSERTIAGHRATLMHQMRAHNTAELVRMLVEGGCTPGADDTERAIPNAN